MNLTPDALSEHFQQVVNYLNHALHDGWYNPPVLAELGKCVAQVQPSSAYTECLDRVRDEFCATLLASPEFHEKLASWDQLDPRTQQRPYLQTCADLMASLYAKASGVTVSTGCVEYYHCDEEFASDAYVAYNKMTHLRDMDVIGINLAFSERQKDLLLALQTIGHEQTHLFNLSLNSAFYYRAIKEDHPLYEEAVYFREEFRKGVYVSHCYGKYAPPQLNPYLLQLDERAAFRVGDGVYDNLQGAVVHGPTRKTTPALIGDSGPYRH
jgi:hypothetical protein